jgi:hypothetical protein
VSNTERWWIAFGNRTAVTTLVPTEPLHPETPSTDVTCAPKNKIVHGQLGTVLTSLIIEILALQRFIRSNHFNVAAVYRSTQRRPL